MGLSSPEPTHGIVTMSLLFPLKACVTVGEALKGMGRPSRKSENRELTATLT